MAKLQTGSNPHIHSGRSTHSYMFDLPIMIYPMAIVAIIIQFFHVTVALNQDFNTGIQVAIQAALVVVVGVGSAILAESLWWKFFDKRYDDFAGWFNIMSTTYPTITGMLYVLCLPINTPLWIVAAGAFVAIILGKTIYGGVGHNIFNPALVGRAFVTISWASALKYTVIDGQTSATPLAFLASESGIITNQQIISEYGSWFNLVFGLYSGSLGETVSFYIILAAIYLIIRKTIEWYIPAVFVGLVFIMSWVAALMNGVDGLGLYFPMYQVLTGGLLLGAVFMATEPVTSPMTRRGKILFAVYLAILTFAIRMLGNYPEGVLFSILIMNMFVPIIDSTYMGQNKGITKKEWAFWILTALLIAGVTYYVGISIGGVA